MKYYGEVTLPRVDFPPRNSAVRRNTPSGKKARQVRSMLIAAVYIAMHPSIADW